LRAEMAALDAGADQKPKEKRYPVLRQ